MIGRNALFGIPLGVLGIGERGVGEVGLLLELVRAELGGNDRRTEQDAQAGEQVGQPGPTEPPPPGRLGGARRGRLDRVGGVDVGRGAVPVGGRQRRRLVGAGPADPRPSDGPADVWRSCRSRVRWSVSRPPLRAAATLPARRLTIGASAGSVAAARTPGAVAVEQEQAHDPAALAGVRGRAGRPSPRRSHAARPARAQLIDVLQVVVADGERVGVAERRAERGTDRPHADATQQAAAVHGSRPPAGPPTGGGGRRGERPRAAPRRASPRSRASGTTTPADRRGRRLGRQQQRVVGSGGRSRRAGGPAGTTGRSPHRR